LFNFPSFEIGAKSLFWLQDQDSGPLRVSSASAQKEQLGEVQYAPTTHRAFAALIKQPPSYFFQSQAILQSFARK